ncbi:MAG: di-trans,poly-cis-decaprenylcistransferase [Clostridiales bacterium]|nr:di-trans,poly-cis-decaprenylcistransferase [Clostridiales bacterium]
MGRNKINGETKIPQHIAIIMDGNGRWAKKRLMPRSFGHKKGMERMIGLMEHAFDLGVPYVTVYALSTENLTRPEEELNGLYDLIRNHFEGYMDRFCEKGVRLRIIGETHRLPADVQEIIARVEEKTKGCVGKGVNVALCYGSRAEIVRAVNLAVEQGKTVTEADVSSLLYTAGQPDPDLMIRTGKEIRLSNFLLWQSAYAELYFSDKMFPDFSDKDLEKAIVWFSSRTRRFGKTDEQVECLH